MENPRVLTTRKAFSTPTACLQNTRFKLAEIKTGIEVRRTFVEKCVVLHASRKLDVPMAAIIKLVTTETEMEVRVTDACLQRFGGYG